MRSIIVANWKMNPATLSEAKLLFNSVKKGTKNFKDREIIICPPFPYLPQLKIRDSNLKLGAQNVFYEEKGAFTGEISPLMLKNFGCEYVIIGHSERRKYFKENDEMINKKIKAVLNFGLKPILCIGETGKERKAKKTFQILGKQLKEGLDKTNIQNKLIIAYEPVWAIGTGKACGISEAKEVNFFIKKLIKNIPILYGGSVNSENARDYIKKANFQGLLVGGASLKPEEFINTVKNASNIYLLKLFRV